MDGNILRGLLMGLSRGGQSYLDTKSKLEDEDQRRKLQQATLALQQRGATRADQEMALQQRQADRSEYWRKHEDEQQQQQQVAALASDPISRYRVLQEQQHPGAGGAVSAPQIAPGALTPGFDLSSAPTAPQPLTGDPAIHQILGQSYAQSRALAERTQAQHAAEKERIARISAGAVGQGARIAGEEGRKTALANAKWQAFQDAGDDPVKRAAVIKQFNEMQQSGAVPPSVPKTRGGQPSRTEEQRALATAYQQANSKLAQHDRLMAASSNALGGYPDPTMVKAREALQRNLEQAQEAYFRVAGVRGGASPDAAGATTQSTAPDPGHVSALKARMAELQASGLDQRTAMHQAASELGMSIDEGS